MIVIKLYNTFLLFESYQDVLLLVVDKADRIDTIYDENIKNCHQKKIKTR